MGLPPSSCSLRTSPYDLSNKVITHLRGILGLLQTTIGEGNGTPLQYSCLENPMDGGAWCAAVHGVEVRQDLASEQQQRLGGEDHLGFDVS